MIGYDNSCHPLHHSNAILKTINEKKNITGKKCNSAPLREHIPEMHQSQLLNNSQEQRNRMLSESRFGFYDTQLNCTLRQRIICFQTGCYQQKCYREKKKRFCFPIQDTYNNEERVSKRDFLKQSYPKNISDNPYNLQLQTNLNLSTLKGKIRRKLRKNKP